MSSDQKDFSQQCRAGSKRGYKSLWSIHAYAPRVLERYEYLCHFLKDGSQKQVSFSYRDRQNGNQKKEITLSADAFIRRFLLHVLPPSFMKIRHIGFLSNKSKKKDIARCREFLGAKEIKFEDKTTRELLRELTGIDLDRCPTCQTGTMLIVKEIPKGRFDTS